MNDRITPNVVSILGRARATAEALDRIVTCFGWLDAAGEIEFLETTVLPDGKLCLRFRDSVGTLREFVLPAVPTPQALRAERAKREITPPAKKRDQP